MPAIMGWIQLLLLCSLWSSFICSSMALSVPMPGDLPIKDEDETVETTYKQLCNGLEVQLKDCNDRLAVKTEYTTSVEIEVFSLKRQLRQLKIQCIESAQAAKLQISALQAQLDSLLKQLGAKTTGPAKEVLLILQKYSNMKKLEVEITIERDSAKVLVLEKQLKVLKAELDEKSLNLTESKCQAGDSSQIAEISKLQEAIDKLRRGSEGSAQSQQLAELERQLAEKLKKLDGAGGGSSTQVTVIIKGHEEILEIQRRLAVLLKTQAEFTALQEQLKAKKTLLSDLNEEKKGHGLNITLNKQIEAVEKEVQALQDELEALNRNLSWKEELEKELLRKKNLVENKLDDLKKDNQELFSRILSVQLELQETQIRWNGEKEAAQVKIADLQKQLVIKEEKISLLLAKNNNLGKMLADRTAECDDLKKKYEYLSKELDGLLKNLHHTSLKQILEIVTLNIDIDSIRSSIARETSQAEIDKLKEQLKDKIIELNAKKDELRTNDRSAAKILTIIEKTREIQNLQNKVVKVDSLDQINDLQKQLIKLINELDDSHPAKLVLKNMAMLSDVNWLKKLISTITQRSEKQVSDLEAQLKEKEETLKTKIAELVKKGSNVDQLTRDIVILRDEVKKLNDEITKVKDSSAAEVKELENKLTKTKQELDKGNQSLNEKDAELAKKVTTITQLIEELRQTKQKAQEKDEVTAAKITDLEDRLKKTEAEKDKARAENRKLQEDLEEAKKCTEVHKTVTEIQEEFKKEIVQLNNTFARQVLTIQTLSEEVSVLQHKLSKSEGNTDELQEELKKKIGELEKTKRELGKARVDSAELLKLLESMRKVSKQQDQSIAEYLAEIDALDKEIQTLMTKAGSTGDEKAQLTIQVLVLKEEMAKLENLQAELIAEALKKATRLEKEIEEMNKEIAFLRRSGCGTDENMKLIARLEEAVKAKERELAQLNKSTEAELDLLKKRVAEKAEKLQSSEALLKLRDKENADLIIRLTDLGQELKEATSTHETFKTTAEIKIKDLESKLKNKEGEVSGLKKSNTDLQEEVKNKDRDISQLRNNNAVLDAELGRKKQELTQAQQDVKDKEATINSVKKQLQKKEEEIQKVADGCKDLESKLKNKEGEVSDLKKSNTDTLEQLKAQQVLVDTKVKELKKVESDNEKLQEQLKDVKEKLKELEEKCLKIEARFTVVSPELNPDTAHRRLLLSGKGKVVKGSQFARFVPDNPERYDSALAAVAKTGYDSGKPYWEVDVDIRACFVVGVAKESAQRKGNLEYGPKYGYWGIIRKKNGQYQAFNDKPITLNLPTPPTVIGILLDFSKGSIIFYNAKTKTPIYTYHNNAFTEKLYPYIETCTDQDKSEPPIVISDVDSTLFQEES